MTQKAKTVKGPRFQLNTPGQHQLEGLQPDRSYKDKASGKETKRPKLNELLRFIRAGDRAADTPGTETS